MAKVKKPNFAKSKKPNLTKAKKREFITIHSSKMSFLTPKAKKTFIYLQKTITQILILCYLDPKCHIYIETDALRYAISKVLSQITLEQHSSNYVIHKD